MINCAITYKSPRRTYAYQLWVFYYDTQCSNSGHTFPMRNCRGIEDKALEVLCAAVE